MPDPAFLSGVQGTSTALMLDPLGRIYVGGATLRGSPVDSVYGHLSRLKPNGTLDKSLLLEGIPSKQNQLHREPSGDLLVGPATIRLRGEYALRILSTDFHANIARVLVRAEAGRTYKLEASSALKFWFAVDTRTAVTCPLELTDPSARSEVARFYRVIALP